MGGPELGIKEFFLQHRIADQPPSRVLTPVSISDSLRLSSQQPLCCSSMSLSLSVLLESVLHRNGFVHQMLIVERLQSRI